MALGTRARWLLGAGVLLSALLTASSVSSQGPNLLQNPGFEAPYALIPGKENCAVAAPWAGWWREGSAYDTSQGYRLAPEYKAAIRADVPGNRVRNGTLSQQWFHSYGNFEAGLYQQVRNLAVGAKVRFELYGMTWSCDRETKGNCGGAVSGDPSPMHVRIGIDPSGGVDPFNAAIVWSPEQDAYDSWHYFQVDAVARASTVTAFVYSYPTYRSQDNNVYVDDASLAIIAPPATATPLPTSKPTITPTATPIPPTKTPYPTSTPAFTPTSIPTCPPTLVPQACPTCPPATVIAPTIPMIDQLTSNQGLPFLFAALVAFVGSFTIGLSLGRGGKR